MGGIDSFIKPKTCKNLVAFQGQTPEPNSSGSTTTTTGWSVEYYIFI